MKCEVCNEKTYTRDIVVGFTRKGNPKVESMSFHKHSNLMYCD